MLSSLKKLKPQKREQGFTIIEVMIVLAIAGLILLIVFLAIPALQRNSRNTQRKNDAAHLASLISEWESNNAGTTPTGFGGGATQINISSERFSIITAPTTIAARPSTPPASVAADTALVYTNSICSGNATAAATSNRSITVWYGIEGSTTSGCIDV